MTQRPTITEIPNPAYIKDQKQRRQFVPYRGSIISTQSPAQPSLKEQMENRQTIYSIDALIQIRGICQGCHESESCGWNGEMRAMECMVVKRNLK
jgi:hypothetical protein